MPADCNLSTVAVAFTKNFDPATINIFPSPNVGLHQGQEPIAFIQGEKQHEQSV